MANTIESEEFYKLMQSHRWASGHSVTFTAYMAYKDVIAHIDKDRAERDKRIVAATVEACANECEREKMFEGARQMSYAHHGVSGAATAIRAITPESVLADIDKKPDFEKPLGGIPLMGRIGFRRRGIAEGRVHDFFSLRVEGGQIIVNGAEADALQISEIESIKVVIFDNPVGGAHMKGIDAGLFDGAAMALIQGITA